VNTSDKWNRCYRRHQSEYKWQVEQVLQMASEWVHATHGTGATDDITANTSDTWNRCCYFWCQQRRVSPVRLLYHQQTTGKRVDGNDKTQDVMYYLGDLYCLRYVHQHRHWREDYHRHLKSYEHSKSIY